MRFASFEIHGLASYGVVDAQQRCWPVPAAFQARHADLKSVIAAQALAERVLQAVGAEPVLLPAQAGAPAQPLSPKAQYEADSKQAKTRFNDDQKLCSAEPDSASRMQCKRDAMQPQEAENAPG